MPLSEVCTVWPSHSKWLSKQNNESASNFALSFNIPLRKLFGRFRRLQLWAPGDRQLHHDNVHSCITSCAQRFGETSNHPGDSAPLQPRFGALWLLTFPKLKSPLKGKRFQTIDSGKYNRAADGHWENRVRSQGVYFKRTEVSLSYVQCFLYLLQ